MIGDNDCCDADADADQCIAVHELLTEAIVLVKRFLSHTPITREM